MSVSVVHLNSGLWGVETDNEFQVSSLPMRGSTSEMSNDEDARSTIGGLAWLLWRSMTTILPSSTCTARQIREPPLRSRIS